VVGTLWPISDETGARVSVDLHDRIRRGIAPAAALRQIQRMSIHRLPPRDWAAFVAVGNLDGL
jgi:CHAT domain-containing protein